MRVNTTYKKLCKINDDLKSTAPKHKLYKCLVYIDFKDDTHYDFLYKVYKKNNLIKEYRLTENNTQTTDDIEQQIKADFNNDVCIEFVEFDYLTTEQLIYLVNENKEVANDI
jgi:hypothetical protein